MSLKYDVIKNLLSFLERNKFIQVVNFCLRVFILATFLLANFAFYLNAQCPADVTLAANDKCLDTGGQISGVTEITLDGNTYTWDAASGFYTNGSSNGCNNFSGFTGTIILDNGTECEYVDGVLPVSWGSFDVTIRNRTSLIQWSTFSEINNRVFEIEHSLDGSRFVKIGEIKSQGNSSEYQFYNFTYINKTSGLQYFRIKQIDFDGVFTYSNVKYVHVEKPETIAFVFPNPSSDRLFLQNFDGQWTINNLTGKFIYAGAGDEIDISQLERGIYYLTLHQSKANRVLKFIKS